MTARELFAMMNAAGDAAFAVDLHGRICYWSDNAEELLGFSTEQALSNNCADIIAGKDDAGYALCSDQCRLLEMARRRGQVPNFDLCVETAAGGRRWLNVSVIVARLQDGASPMVVHLMRDVDHRKKLELVTRNILVQIGQLTGQKADEVLHQGPSQRLPVDLTRRELSVLQMLSLGRDTREIAVQLHISTATVRNHIQHILRKLDCHTRLEAVIRAARSGWI